MSRPHGRIAVESSTLIVAVCAAFGLAGCVTYPKIQTEFRADPAVAGVPGTLSDAAAKAPAPPQSGDVLVAGGASGTKAVATAEIYRPTTGEWALTGALSTNRFSPSVVPTGAGVLIAGGSGATASTKGGLKITLSPTATSDLFDPVTGQAAATTGPMGTARVGATATDLGGGLYLVAGGLDAAGNPASTAEVFDSASGTFAPAANPMNSPRAFHTATRLADGTVLIAGGEDNNSTVKGRTTSTAEVYDHATGVFLPTLAPMNSARALHTATLLANGKVLVAGGDSATYPGVEPTDSADLYDPVARTFSFISGGMNEARFLHSATLLADDRVLITGGLMGSAFFNLTDGSLGGIFGMVSNTAEIYDPNTSTFTCIGGQNPGLAACNPSMTHTHAGHVAVRLGPGPLADQVLVAGGFGGKKIMGKAKPNNAAELYDPATGTFRKTGKMRTARGLAGAALIP